MLSSVGAGLVPKQASKVPKDGACQAAAAAAVTVEWAAVIRASSTRIKATSDQRHRNDKGWRNEHK